MPEQKSLVRDLGSRYVRDFFLNALFVMDDKLHKLRYMDEEQATVDSIRLDDSAPKWERGFIPANRFLDFTTFKYPKLGYRQFHQGKLGKIVVHVTSLRNAQRGLKDENIQYKRLPVYDAIDHGHTEGWGHVSAARRAKEIFKPTFTPFSQGIAQLLAGECVGFAVSEDLAVGLSINTAIDRGADIYFRGRVVGNVDESGKVTIVNKILQRDSLQKKLFR